MADELAKVADAAAKSAEPVIHVIPEKFYGGALAKRAPEPASVPAKTSSNGEAAVPGAKSDAGKPGLPAAPGMGGKDGKPPMPGAVAKGSGKKKRLIIIGGIVLLILLLGGGAALLFSPSTPPTPPVNTVPQTSCGDGVCQEATESYANCSADCKIPAPVCGDGQCAATETYAACPSDCEPPAPKCGDGACDSGEDALSCSADCRATVAKPGSDLDSDGMSDREETEVFGTDPNSPNTDKDSFVDLNEALNLFDPALPSPAMLADSPRMATYREAAGWTILYPKAWKVVPAGAESPLEFMTPSGQEFVSVEEKTKPAGQPLMDWYLAAATNVTSSQVEPYTTRGGYQAVLSPDRMTAYVDLGGTVLQVSYSLGEATEIQYRVTFQMMVQSILKTTPPPESATE